MNRNNSQQNSQAPKARPFNRFSYLLNEKSPQVESFSQPQPFVNLCKCEGVCDAEPTDSSDNVHMLSHSLIDDVDCRHYHNYKEITMRSKDCSSKYRVSEKSTEGRPSYQTSNFPDRNRIIDMSPESYFLEKGRIERIKTEGSNRNSHFHQEKLKEESFSYKILKSELASFQESQTWQNRNLKRESEQSVEYRTPVKKAIQFLEDKACYQKIDLPSGLKSPNLKGIHMSLKNKITQKSAVQRSFHLESTSHSNQGNKQTNISQKKPEINIPFARIKISLPHQLMSSTGNTSLKDQTVHKLKPQQQSRKFNNISLEIIKNSREKQFEKEFINL